MVTLSTPRVLRCVSPLKVTQECTLYMYNASAYLPFVQTKLMFQKYRLHVNVNANGLM